MQLEGSCHCGAVSFSLTSAHPYPYQRCYCSICRKTQGGGGYSINIAGESSSLKVRGRKHIAIYHARLKEEGTKRAHRSTAERHFCSLCSSGLWLFSPEWPELIHPSHQPSTLHCRCRRNTRTCCSIQGRRGWKSKCVLETSSSMSTPKSRSPSGMNVWV